MCEHKCNEPLCVRVRSGHLVQSTHSENVRYAIAMGGCRATRCSTARGVLVTSGLLQSVRHCVMGTTRTQCFAPRPTPATGRGHCSDGSGQGSAGEADRDLSGWGLTCNAGP
ncbi:hypothetical protein [Rhodococcus coprophilus]|uniref:hypothetical protein n=1 Tax=Rhodococcus coprophilus TaxID=38310 RepID=UPI001E388784|nr:hypothetical protein [Rhodococcus coprophilus]